MAAWIIEHSIIHDGRSHHPITILFWCRSYIRYVSTQPGSASLATHWIVSFPDRQ